MSVEQARKACQVIVSEIAKGNDPQASRQAARHEQTVGGLWVYWLDSHAKPHKKSWKEDERMYRLYLSPWAKRRLSTIRKTDVQTLMHRIAGDTAPSSKKKKKCGGKYMANRVHELIRAMFHRAVDIGYRGENPAIGIKRFPEEKRDRFLHGDELRAFFVALEQEPNTLLQHFFLLLLLIGARRSNVQSMRWSEIDFATALWRIPETKSGKPVTVPLSAAALDVLHARQEAGNGSEWVFPSKSKTGHIVEPKAAWKRIITRAGLVDVRPHDCRRSLGSWMAMSGASLPTIGKSLGHKRSVTTEIYARLTVGSVRQAVETATAAMLTAGNLTIDAEGMKLLSNEKEEHRG
jgi:integrase